METRWTLQVILLATAATSWAQNFQPQLGGFQPQASGQFLPGTQAQRATAPTQASPARVHVPQDTTQTQGGFAGSQGFQGAPQTRVRAQSPLRTPASLALRQQQRQQQLRQFEQPQVTVPVTQFDQPQVARQVIEQAPVVAPVVQQFQQQQTAQQVNQQNFEQAQRFQQQQHNQQQHHQQQNFEQAQRFQQQQQHQQQQQQSFEQPQAPPPVVRRLPPPSQDVTPVVRTPAQTQTRHQHQTQHPQVSSSSFDEDLFRQQAENAHYTFASSVMDGISDQEHVREETRDGLNLKGHYSYSDGYFKRTVYYEADENGYRVIKEEVDPIGDGPQEDPNGRAEVSSSIGGNNLQYSVLGTDIAYRAMQRAKSQQQFQQQQQQPFATTA